MTPPTTGKLPDREQPASALEVRKTLMPTKYETWLNILCLANRLFSRLRNICDVRKPSKYVVKCHVELYPLRCDNREAYWTNALLAVYSD